MPLLSVPATQNSSSNKTSDMLVRNKLRYYADAYNSVSNDGSVVGGSNTYMRNAVKGKYISSILNYRATMYNGAEWVDDGETSYWDFDGTNDYMVLAGSGNNTDWDFTKTDDDGSKLQWTIEVWLYPNRTNSQDYWIGRYQNNNAYKSFMMGMYGPKMRTYLWRDAFGSYNWYQATNDIPYQTWGHYAWTVNNDTQVATNPRRIHHYYNCVQQGSWAESSLTIFDGGGRLVLVGTPFYYSWCYYGRIAQIRLYHRRLSLNELKRNYNRDCVKFGLTKV